MSAKRKDNKGLVTRTGESQRKDLTYQYRYTDAGGITVVELLERYISLKQGVRYAATVGDSFVLNLVKKEDFGQRRIRDIKPSDAKLWLMKLQKNGRDTASLPVFAVL